MVQPKLISLFCGPGGLDLGFHQAGFQTVLAIDNDESAVATHRHNHPEAAALKLDLTQKTSDDLARIWEERCDEPPVGIIGGPPCQSFSYANTNQSDEDARHSLPLCYAELLRGLNERYGLDFFLFENVPGLRGLHREKFEHFKAKYRDAGFRLYEAVLEAWWFGVPQLRPRVFIVGVNEAKYPDMEFHFPAATCQTPHTVREAIGKLPPPRFYERGASMDDNPVHPNHWTMNPKSKKFFDGTLSRAGKFGKSFAVLDWDKPSLTVAYGHREVHVHPSGQRRLSVYEAMLLQGFPSEYRLLGTLSDQIRLVSEVVAPPVAYHIASAVADQFGYQKRRVAAG